MTGSNSFSPETFIQLISSAPASPGEHGVNRSSMITLRSVGLGPRTFVVQQYILSACNQQDFSHNSTSHQRDMKWFIMDNTVGLSDFTGHKTDSNWPTSAASSCNKWPYTSPAFMLLLNSKQHLVPDFVTVCSQDIIDTRCSSITCNTSQPQWLLAVRRVVGSRLVTVCNFRHSKCHKCRVIKKAANNVTASVLSFFYSNASITFCLPLTTTATLNMLQFFCISGRYQLIN